MRNSPAHLTRPSRDQSCLRAAETGSTGARRELSRQLVRRVRRTLCGWQPGVARTKEGKTSQVTTWLISFVYYDCSTVCVYITFLYVVWHRITTHQPVDNQPAWPEYFWPCFCTVRHCHGRCHTSAIQDALHAPCHQPDHWSVLVVRCQKYN